MSKPIMIVFVIVVIDVVFVKKNKGPKKFWLKKDPCPENLRATKLWSKKNVVPKIKVLRNFGPKNVGSKLFLKSSVKIF